MQRTHTHMNSLPLTVYHFFPINEVGILPHEELLRVVVGTENVSSICKSQQTIS